MSIKKGIYRHFKGNIYEVIAVAKHSEDMTDLVIYKSVADGKYWARPAEMWQESVVHNGNTMQRFTLIEEIK